MSWLPAGCVWRIGLAHNRVRQDEPVADGLWRIDLIAAGHDVLRRQAGRVMGEKPQPVDGLWSRRVDKGLNAL